MRLVRENQQLAAENRRLRKDNERLRLGLKPGLGPKEHLIASKAGWQIGQNRVQCLARQIQAGVVVSIDGRECMEPDRPERHEQGRLL